MPRPTDIAIAYGPPSEHGVEQIMGLGQYGVAGLEDADFRDPINMSPDEALQYAGWLSVGACIVGSVIGSTFLKNAGVGGAAVAFGVKYLTRQGSK